ncbi:hypothetical protein EWE75_11235 [Sphingomonas populi]|uniref:DUF4276 family protein n=1 Tax=Sphingomonas populi TaxID=2484750 RepID=A0A4Q6Y4L9_9SPHN|nr:DUF3226 domain-containing protein [Sphingomonas populi]RZF64327.1 hypothetical protein EWE75_11235 [Sphingomonas populi]
MQRFLVIVEGPHDASFLGVELRERGFKKVESLEDVDVFWRILIPKIFPSSNKLTHVVAYPDIFRKAAVPEQSCAIVVAGGDSRILSECRAVLETLDGSQLDGICLVADADDNSAEHRHIQLCRGLEALNVTHGPGGKEGGTSGLPGFPLPIPAFGAIGPGKPKVGLFVLPDNDRPGTLDTLLIECARTSFSAVVAHAETYVVAANAAVADDGRFKALRKPSGQVKAMAGVIGNVLLPGSALSVAIDRGAWHNPRKGDEKSLNAFRAFLDAFLV